jgi:hypothetical protein
MQANSATPATSSRSPAAPAPATKTPGAENVRPPPQPPEPPRFLAVWVKNQPRVDWLAAHDVNGADLQQMSAKNDHLGYMPVSISGYVGQADRYSFAAVWIKKPRTIEVVSNHSLEPAEFRRQEVSLARRRFRPLWLDVYGQGTEWRYATVWIRDNANIVWRVETFDDEPKKARQAVWDSLMASGHFPRVDSAYIDSRRVIHQTQLWHKESILHFVWFGDFTFYQAKLDEHKSGDAGPIYVDSYGDGPNVSFTQIGNASGGVEWTTTAARTGAEFQQAFDRLSKDGYRPTVINVR